MRLLALLTPAWAKQIRRWSLEPGASCATTGEDSAIFSHTCLKGLGEVNIQIGQKRKGLEYLNEALSLYQQAGDWLHEVQVLPLISALRSSLGQSTEAMKSARAAVDRAKEKGASDWEAYGYFAVGAAYMLP